MSFQNLSKCLTDVVTMLLYLKEIQILQKLPGKKWGRTVSFLQFSKKKTKRFTQKWLQPQSTEATCDISLSLSH